MFVLVIWSLVMIVVAIYFGRKLKRVHDSQTKEKDKEKGENEPVNPSTDDSIPDQVN